MTHKFDVKNKSKLDNPHRRELLPPSQILTDIEVKEGDVLADIGAGIGYFSIPAAQRVGASGSVFALDIHQEMLEDVRAKADKEGLSNIETILTDEYNLKIDGESSDVALMSAVLHEVEDKDRFIKEAKRILKPGGRLAIIEWQKKQSEFGPPEKHRLDTTEVESVLKENGFTDIASNMIGEQFYCVIGYKG